MSSTVFLYYGIACLLFDRMKRDFERFGLGRFRTLTGALEVLGALGLIAGAFWPPLVLFSAGGLALLMMMGIVARIRVRDSLAQTLPALLLMCMNLFIVWHALAQAGPEG
jgi:energy-coupling factor transporter transmembrane protein EcfT